jgi:hypothetical protein
LRQAWRNRHQQESAGQPFKKMWPHLEYTHHSVTFNV